MNTFKLGDKVRAVKDCDMQYYMKGDKGVIVAIDCTLSNVKYDNGISTWAYPDEIELIESEPNQSVPKSFPTFEEFHEWYRTEQGNMQGVYHYFAQFGKQPSQPNSKPFPWIGEAIDDLKGNLFGIKTEQFETIYNYFAQFGVRTVEVFPEVGKEYEFSCSKAIWYKGVFQKYLCTVDGHTDRATHIRPIQPSRLEQLMAKHPNLTDTQQAELLHLLLTQTKQKK